ncbi:MAG: DNA photolyase family protein [Pirellulales bacterium]|nr:DNA photolyase family protein [Pirellulales bacterium]
MSQDVVIIWFRRDLRLADNAALRAAAKRGAVVPVFVLEEDESRQWAMGGASRWWLHQSLASLEDEFARRDMKLILRRGDARQCLNELVDETGASAVFWNRQYEPDTIARDTRIKENLASHGIEVESSSASLLFEPWEIQKKDGTPFQVFTPFWKHCLAQDKGHDALSAPRFRKKISSWPASDELADWGLEPTIPWDEGMRETWTVSPAAAVKRLRKFLKSSVGDYKDGRNLMDTDGTSCLSPYLHFGQISPREVWTETRAHIASHPRARDGADCFLSEIGWREFGYHLLYHFPHTTNQPLRETFERFPWQTNARHLRAWQRGQTGYPMVDAAMRQLWHTGWMHNRARMIVASFLCKHLLITWQRGAEWFWDTLVDADLASNTLGWQWTAGCGADAAPYFRIFNPITQGEKFDPSGRYIRRWVPELAKLPDKWLYQPWEAPDDVLAEAGVRLGENYPRPIVKHAEARQAALDAYAQARKGIDDGANSRPPINDSRSAHC